MKSKAKTPMIKASTKVAPKIGLIQPVSPLTGGTRLAFLRLLGRAAASASASVFSRGSK